MVRLSNEHYKINIEAKYRNTADAPTKELKNLKEFQHT